MPAVLVRKKTPILEAMQWTMKNSEEVLRWAAGCPGAEGMKIVQHSYPNDPAPRWELELPASGYAISEGHWVIKNEYGDLNGRSQLSFSEQYERVKGDAPWSTL